MASDLQNTIAELKAIITDLKTQADLGTAWTGTGKADVEKRINHINDKTQPNHTNLTNALKFDTKDLDNLETLIGSDKAKWAIEKTSLEKAKTDAEKDKKDKVDELKAEQDNHAKTKIEVADKLTSDLVSGLNTLINTGLKKPKKKADGTDEKDAQGNIIYEDIFDKTLMEAVKSGVEEIKTKGAKADLSELKTSLDGIKSQTDKISESKGTGDQQPAGTNYWSIGACIGSGIAVLLLGYVAFFKPSNGNTIIKNDNNE